jgi:hypothetical protein
MVGRFSVAYSIRFTYQTGANLEWPDAFGLGKCPIGGKTKGNSVFMFGLLNAVLFWSGAAVGSLISDTVINEWRFGR